MLDVRLYVLLTVIGICWANSIEYNGKTKVNAAIVYPNATLGDELQER